MEYIKIGALIFDIGCLTAFFILSLYNFYKQRFMYAAIAYICYKVTYISAMT